MPLCDASWGESYSAVGGKQLGEIALTQVIGKNENQFQT